MPFVMGKGPCNTEEDSQYPEIGIGCHYWTDRNSKVVLGFISNELNRFHTYIANSVQLIHKQTTPSQRHYVETDGGSRGMSPKDFVEKSEWIKGPDFLKEPVGSWLKEEKYEEQVDADSLEITNVNFNTGMVEESSDILKRPAIFQSA